MSQAFQTFSDGYVSIMQAGLKDGETVLSEAVEVLKTLEPKLYYDERTVGINRFYQGRQNDIRVDRLIRCPKIKSVLTSHYAVTEDGNQYYIRQIQYPVGVMPETMDLSLEMVRAKMQMETPIV